MFGPPWGVTPTSSCPCVVHVVSRLPPRTHVALFGLAFAAATAQNALTWPVTVSRRIIMQKARHHPSETPRRVSRSRALTACRHVVSGSLSSPHRGSSHLSLALLGTLSVAREYLALRDGPRSFGPTFTCWALLRCRPGGPAVPRTGLSPAVVALSRAVPLRQTLVTPCPSRQAGPTTPGRQVPPVWALPRSLAATDGVAFAFLSWG